MVRLPPASRIDRFEIKSLIGSGGMGTLYLARDTSPNTYRLVALKLLSANLDSEDLRERFGREARSLASLNHPNVVNIHECGEYRGSPYIVMEYVRGETLAEKIKRKAPLSLTQKLKLMMELCAGLAHAHEAGIIHRDIKPANLMVDHHGRLRLLDFGIARVVESGLTVAGVQMTQINVRIGTPGYMSPEQYEGAEIDRRSDIFAVGAVFYELLAYREAFPGATTRQIEKKVLETEPERLTAQIAGLDPDIEALVARALQKNPDKRFQDAAGMERALTKVWWRLGPAESPGSAPRLTPPPVAGGGRKSSRADAAYERALAALDERAPEAALRYAMEALAEDSKHEGARRFLAKHNPEFRLPNPSPPPPPPREETWIDPTIVSSRSELNLLGADAEQTIVSIPGARRPASGPGKRATKSPGAIRKKAGPFAAAEWTSYRVAIGAIALAIVIGGAALVAMLLRSSSSPVEGELLTVTRPVNGTIVGDDINCGTQGSDCSITVATGTIVALELRPDKGFSAKGYTGDCAQSGRVRMSTARACGATFVADSGPAPEVTRQTLTIYATEGGVVRAGNFDCRATKLGCSQQFSSGQSVDLEAQADKGYTFDRFTGACDADGRVLMSAPQTCGASFLPNSGVGTRGTQVGPVVEKTTPAGVLKTAKNGSSSAGVKASGNTAQGAGGPSGGTPGGGSTTGGADGKPAPPPPSGNDPKAATSGGPPAPPDPPAPDVQAKADIETVLQTYRRQYEGLNFAGVRTVYPTVHPEFADQLARYVKMKFSYLGPPKFIDLNLQDSTAVVEVGVSQTYLSKGRSKEEQGKVKSLQLNLHRRTADNRWVITKVRFEQ